MARQSAFERSGSIVNAPVAVAGIVAGLLLVYLIRELLKADGK
jgi:hypothetical protein